MSKSDDAERPTGSPVLNAAFDAVLSIDEGGLIVGLNDAATGIFGLSRIAALGSPVDRLVDFKEMRNAASSGDSGTDTESGGTIRRQVEARRADGELFAARLALTRTSEDPLRYTAWIRDLDECRSAGQLDPSRAGLLSRAEEIAELGSWKWEVGEDELLWSDNLFRIFGFEPGSITPTLSAVTAMTHPDDAARVDALTDRARSGGALQPLEYRIVRPDGAVRYLRASMASISEDGGANVIVGTVQDLTERRRAEREIAANVAVSEALAEWTSFEEGAQRLLSGLADAMECQAGILWVPRGGVLRSLAIWQSGTVASDDFIAEKSALRLPRGSVAAGRAWGKGEPVVADESDRSDVSAGELRPVVALPVVHSPEILAVLELYACEHVELTERLLRSLIRIGHELEQFFLRRRGELDPPSLTPREVTVLQLAADGLSGPRIAERLVVSLATVKTHFEHIYAKLGVGERAGAVAEAMRLGLVH